MLRDFSFLVAITVRVFVDGTAPTWGFLITRRVCLVFALIVMNVRGLDLFATHQSHLACKRVLFRLGNVVVTVIGLRGCLHTELEKSVKGPRHRAVTEHDKHSP